MNAPTGRNASVKVIENAISASLRPNSFAIAVSVMTTTKKSKASRVQPRKPATTACPRPLWWSWLVMGRPKMAHRAGPGYTGPITPRGGSRVRQVRREVLPPHVECTAHHGRLALHDAWRDEAVRLVRRPGSGHGLLALPSSGRARVLRRLGYRARAVHPLRRIRRRRGNGGHVLLDAHREEP